MNKPQISLSMFSATEQAFIISMTLHLIEYADGQGSVENLLSEEQGIDEQFIANLSLKIRTIIQAGEQMMPGGLDLSTVEIGGSA